MAERFIIASGKGGVGKSTFTVFLAQALTGRGRNVLLIDTDIALSALDILLDAGEKIVYNWYDVIHERCAAKDALIPINEKLKLLPPPLSIIWDILPAEMRALGEKYDADFDYILIDAPAGVGTGLLRAASAAEKALVIATPDDISVRGALATASLLDNIGIQDAGLIINRFRTKAVEQGKLLDLDSMIDKTGIRLMGIVPEYGKLVFSPLTRQMPPPQSHFMGAFRRIAARLEGEHVLLGNL